MKFIAFDLETTGTISSVDRIIELGFIKFEDGVIIDKFSCLVDPLMPIPKAASQVNGISNEMVIGKSSIESLLEPLTSYCGNDPLVAHNANFDFQFLLSDYKKFNIPAPTGTIFDTLHLSRKVYPGLMNYKLASIAKHLSIHVDSLHRAEDDARYCGMIFQKIIKRLYPNQEPHWKDLIRLSGRPEIKFPKIEKQLKQLSLF